MVDFGGGTHVLTASYEGDSRTPASMSGPLTVVIDAGTRTPQQITFLSVGDRTFSTSPIQLVASYNRSSGVPVVYSVVSGPARITGGLANDDRRGVGDSSRSQDGNTNYLAAPPATQSFRISPAPQTILVQQIIDGFYSVIPFELTATASSGLPVTLSVISGPLRLDGKMATMLGTGTATLEATQAGNAVYLQAPKVSIVVRILPGSQTITFPVITRHLISDPPFALNATSSSGLPVSYHVTGPAEVSGNTLTVKGLGIVTVEANQAGTRTMPRRVRSCRRSSYFPADSGSTVWRMQHRMDLQRPEATQCSSAMKCRLKHCRRPVQPRAGWAG